ncbi:MAG: SDR family NAD(P)-dependent oxidoreductase [Saprospiraceae bacterium]|nr:SDR family NAD(P)-dependent oxidoreductase [Saprospiraceae bacterium]
MLQRFQKRNICITGASSGIGEALARTLAGGPCTLVLMARNVARLEQLKMEWQFDQTEVIVLPIDLEDPASITSAARSMADRLPHLDWLFHVGGISQRGTAADTDFQVVQRIMQIDFLGAVQLTTECRALLNASEAPGIVVTSSMTGLFGFPYRSAYAAAKHALQGYFESMQLESASPYVCIVSPGSIRTDISFHALEPDGQENGKPDPRLEKGMTAQEAAKCILKGVARGKLNIYVGRSELLMIYFHRYLPFLFKWIAKRTPAK